MSGIVILLKTRRYTTPEREANYLKLLFLSRLRHNFNTRIANQISTNGAGGWIAVTSAPSPASISIVRRRIQYEAIIRLVGEEGGRNQQFTNQQVEQVLSAFAGQRRSDPNEAFLTIVGEDWNGVADVAAFSRLYRRLRERLYEIRIQLAAERGTRGPAPTHPASGSERGIQQESIAVSRDSNPPVSGNAQPLRPNATRSVPGTIDGRFTYQNLQILWPQRIPVTPPERPAPVIPLGFEVGLRVPLGAINHRWVRFSFEFEIAAKITAGGENPNINLILNNREVKAEIAQQLARKTNLLVQVNIDEIASRLIAWLEDNSSQDSSLIVSILSTLEVNVENTTLDRYRVSFEPQADGCLFAVTYINVLNQHDHTFEIRSGEYTIVIKPINDLILRFGLSPEGWRHLARIAFDRLLSKILDYLIKRGLRAIGDLPAGVRVGGSKTVIIEEFFKMILKYRAVRILGAAARYASYLMLAGFFIVGARLYFESVRREGVRLGRLTNYSSGYFDAVLAGCTDRFPGYALGKRQTIKDRIKDNIDYAMGFQDGRLAANRSQTDRVYLTLIHLFWQPCGSDNIIASSWITQFESHIRNGNRPVDLIENMGRCLNSNFEELSNILGNILR